jgi:hypothetical protein
MGPRLLGDDPFGHSGKQPAKRRIWRFAAALLDEADGSPFALAAAGAVRNPERARPARSSRSSPRRRRAKWGDPRWMPDPGTPGMADVVLARESNRRSVARHPTTVSEHVDGGVSLDSGAILRFVVA